MSKYPRYRTFDWHVGQLRFRIVLGNSTYSVALFDATGDRIAWSGRHWGCSLTDALAMACHTGDPSRAASAIWFLFGRIDYYVDGPGIIDLWRAATLERVEMGVAA